MKLRKDCDSGYILTTKQWQIAFGIDWKHWLIGVWVANRYIFSVGFGPFYSVFRYWRRKRAKT